jgi:DNA-binding transcriptional ArsR family regulator
VGAYQSGEPAGREPAGREPAGRGLTGRGLTGRGLTGLGLLGDPTRRVIFEKLTQGPCSVGQLAAELPVSRPAVSQHLRALKEAGLVTDRADGTRRIYHVNPDGVAGLRAYLDRIWGDALASFKAAVEAADDSEG